MTCCPVDFASDAASAFAGDITPWVFTDKNGERSLDLIVPGIVEPAHMPLVEGTLQSLEGVTQARVNYTTRRVRVFWRSEDFNARSILDELARLGFSCRPFDPSLSGFENDDQESRQLLMAVAVSGFAAANIMLLSVSVWSGAEIATREMFHWLSAAIALPTVAFAGKPFFRSAFRALSSGQMNMDVPISLAICMATLMSLYSTFHHGEYAYFDASVTLLFFLLTGRYLDHLMRVKARSAVSQLLSLSTEQATVIDENGEARSVPAGTLQPAMTLSVAAGERLAADGMVIEGSSEIDRSLVTGETTPESVAPGAVVHAGMLNLTGPLTVKITAAGRDTFLSEIIRLMTSAEQSRSRFVRMADKLARVYSPLVHVMAGLTLITWLWITGGDWHTSLMTATAVLIITCPCALGLAVPAVHVVANGVLYRGGAMIKDATAIEKLALVDTIVFDKTGTLTLGKPRLLEGEAIPDEALSLAAGLAQASRHPLSRALCVAAHDSNIVPAAVSSIQEHPGHGLSGAFDGREVRLGSHRWCGVEANSTVFPEFVLDDGTGQPRIFQFEDEMRSDAKEVIAELKSMHMDIRILSGDRNLAVKHAAGTLGIKTWAAECTPQSKLETIENLKKAGRKTLVVGDGLNDAPALAAGLTSMAPSTAADVGRTAADMVFFGQDLSPVALALKVAQKSQALCRQNFALAAGYNFLAVPVAAAGMASPLIAAIAMSTSSIIVIANSLRLGLQFPASKRKVTTAARPGVSELESVPA